MNSRTYSHLTQCGLPGVGSIPRGIHICHGYTDRAQLIQSVISYTLAGLAGNERCIIVAAPPAPESELLPALRRTSAGVDRALQSGALRILDSDLLYRDAPGLKHEALVEYWLEEERQALAQGFAGLRVAGNIGLLPEPEWAAFVAYERAVTTALLHKNAVLMCSYALNDCSELQREELMNAHGCTLICDSHDPDWQVVVWDRSRVTRGATAKLPSHR